MLKTFIFSPKILIIFLSSLLSWTTVYAQNVMPMTCSPYEFDVKLMSSDCESPSNDSPSSRNKWPAGQIPYIGITQSNCCTGGGDVCSTSCSTNWLNAEKLSEFTLQTTDGITISTTLLEQGVGCQSDPLIMPSQPLPPGQYTLTSENDDGSSYMYFFDLDFEVIDDTITLELPPEEASPSQIEGYVWQDLDEDGIRDEDEPGTADVDVDLISVCWGHGAFESYWESHNQTVTSDSEGFFHFADVSPEMYNNNYSYALRFSPDQTYTEPNQGEDSARDSNALASCEDRSSLERIYRGYQCIVGTTDDFRVSSGETVRTIDAGVLSTSTETPNQRGEISGRKWDDINGNGVRDSGELGIEGATFTLQMPDGTTLATTTTDEEGNYSFTNLEPGEYVVACEPPIDMELTDPNVGNDDTIDSDADPATGLIESINVPAGGVVANVDVGVVQGEGGIMRGIVWLDDDADGLLDVDEVGIAGITVNLLDPDGILLAVTVTDVDGIYSFPIDSPINYIVEFELPDGLRFTSPNFDSDVDPATGRSPSVVGGGDVDAGIVLKSDILGDVNCNGESDLFDVIDTLKYQVELLAPSEQCPPPAGALYLPACDNTGDDQCNIFDVVNALKCLVRIPVEGLCSFIEGTTFSNPANPEGPDDNIAAQSDATLHMDVSTIEAGTTFTTAVMVDTDATVAASQVSVSYDANQFRVVDCQVVAGVGMCNPNYGADTVLFNAAIQAGATGSLHLANITFEHIGERVEMSTFQLGATTLADTQEETIGVTVEHHTVGDYRLYLPMIER